MLLPLVWFSTLVWFWLHDCSFALFYWWKLLICYKMEVISLNCWSENRKSSCPDVTKLEALQALGEGKTVTSVWVMDCQFLNTLCVSVLPLMCTFEIYQILHMVLKELIECLFWFLVETVLWVTIVIIWGVCIENWWPLSTVLCHIMNELYCLKVKQSLP
jgi:hypothetical protein